MRHASKLLTLLVLFPMVMKAQTNIKFGVRAGLNYINNVYVKDNWERLDDEREFRIGYHFGVLSKLNLTAKFSTSLEILYSNQGYYFPRRVVGFNGSSITRESSKINYNYLIIPLFIEYHPISKLTIQAGPQIGYLLSAKNKLESETIDLMEWWGKDGLLDSLINRFDFGLGLGCEFRVTEKTLIGLRYFHGLSSLTNNNRTGFDDQGNPAKLPSLKEQNRNIQLSFAYLIW